MNNSPAFRGVLRSAEKLTMASQRLISPRDALAREYARSRPVADLPLERHAHAGHARICAACSPSSSPTGGWRSTGWSRGRCRSRCRRLRSLPHRTQITRHDCVEGWSAIGKWHGVQLSRILEHAGLSTRAKYIVFHCADRFGDKPYYESIDLVDAFHPQTILAWGMNGHLLPVPNGAPLRLRVERQLGYKQAKYVQRIEAVDSLAGIQGGKGGYWEDNVDYEWYAGI